MTTATAALCGHGWAGPVCVPLFGGTSGPLGVHHECVRDADHRHRPGLADHNRCRCRCGATTTRPEGDR